mgnify:CR=1 FL=1
MIYEVKLLWRFGRPRIFPIFLPVLLLAPPQSPGNIILPPAVCHQAPLAFSLFLGGFLHGTTISFFYDVDLHKFHHVDNSLAHNPTAYYCSREMCTPVPCIEVGKGVVLQQELR